MTRKTLIVVNLQLARISQLYQTSIQCNQNWNTTMK